MTFREFMVEKRAQMFGDKGDCVVVHTTPDYEGQATLVPKRDIIMYFSEANGFDEDVYKNIQKMKSGGVSNVGVMSPESVIVIKL